MKYRSDISGLRALAVVPVVLYHLDPALVPGGYVGVDVFFVISGYLITRILAADLTAERFHLATFYDRRVRRIVPAYALVALATSLAALVILPPAMLAAYGESLTAASVFLANRHFLATTGYFGAAPDTQFLLHTWSLSVEEQFYLAWPLLLALLFHPRLARFRGPLVWLLLLVSLAIATRNAVARPERAFYNSNGRFWELLLGAVLALGLVPRLRRQWIAEAMAGLGLVMVGVALVLFDHDTLFPGASALIPTGGALLIIWAGEEGRRTWVGRGLSFAPFAGIGLISYSLYLWHWPVLAVHRFLTLEPPSLWDGALLAVAMVVVSALSWRFVENPFRRHGPATRRSELASIATGVAVLAALVALGLAMSLTKGFPGRADAGFAAAQAALSAHWKGTPACLLGPRATAPDEAACRFGRDGADALMVLWGDSYGDHQAPALDRLAAENGYGLLQLTKAGCYPSAPQPTTMLAGEEAAACNAFRARSIARIIEDPAVRAVVIAGQWPPGPALPGAMAGLGRAVDEIRAAGKAVLLLGPPGDFPKGGGACTVRRRFMGADERVCDMPRAWSDALSGPVEEQLTALAAARTGVAAALPRAVFCDAAACRPVRNGLPVFIDAGHLNVEGSLATLSVLRAIPGFPPPLGK